jgi:dihydrofolate reductase
MASDVFLLGRETYELFKEFWSDESDYAARMNSIPKLVASTILRGPLEWNASLIEGDVAEEVAKLKKQPGRDILMYGSPTLMRTLAKHDLIDEYLVWVHPVVLGSGKRLFSEGFEKTTLKLVDTEPLSSGVVILTYRPA